MNISEMGKGEKKKSNTSSNLLKKLEKYLSMKKVSGVILSKSKSWHGRSTTTIAPEGCFWVYVGPNKERFVVKTKYANHPLFKMLLEDAEKEYGYSYSQGPILLPCDVDIFYKVLAEMVNNKEIDDSVVCGSCSPLFSPSRRLGNSQMAKGYGSYKSLTPPRLFKRLNSFNCA
ncbi:auxin-responsive protein SAUR71-like [Solanum dulcamara]|uniref:auxin-responsive protein SAUR71-like n=1 Tax=Solanum dulcamara TaxID=45834 RepID=UPI002486A8DD|nr:auxin-responsive protein SAUR71-like [Solanum dulcamara]